MQVKCDIIDVVPRALGVLVAKDIFRDVLDKVPILRGLNTAVKDALYLKLQPRHFSPGEKLLRKGQEVDGVSVVLMGHVHIMDEKTSDSVKASGFSSSTLDTSFQPALDFRCVFLCCRCH